MPRTRRPATLAALPLLLIASAASGQPADPRWSVTLSYENDTLGGSDRYYTSGLQLAARSPSADLPGPLRWLDDRLDWLLGPGEVRWGFGIGHQIYTPRDTLSRVPDPRDRPYAGYLYGAAVLQRQERNALSTFELQLGVVGPSALGEFVQNNIHDLIRDESVNGWGAQLKDEPALNAVFERIARTPALRLGPVEADLLPAATVSLGNVSTYAAAGATLRIGRGLDADFGPRASARRWSAPHSSSRARPRRKASAGMSSAACRAGRWRGTSSSTATPSATAPRWIAGPSSATSRRAWWCTGAGSASPTARSGGRRSSTASAAGRRASARSEPRSGSDPFDMQPCVARPRRVWQAAIPCP
jgi:hypothetical protein